MFFLDIDVTAATLFAEIKTQITDGENYRLYQTKVL